MSEEIETALKTTDASVVEFAYRATSHGDGRVLLAKYKWEMHDANGLTESEMCVESRIVPAERFDGAVEHYREMGEKYPANRAIKWLLATPLVLL